jgi:hypothetical protein
VKTRSFFVICASAAAFSPCFADSTASYSLRPLGAGFTVQMPAQPQSGSKLISEEGIKYRVYKWAAVKDDLLYTVSYSDINVTISSAQADQLLENIIGGMVKTRKYDVYQDDKVDVQGRPGRLFMLADKQGLGSLGMTCWDGKHAFVISLRGPKSRLGRETARPFFKTFKLLPN